jgi:hypothetical protein
VLRIILVVFLGQGFARPRSIPEKMSPKMIKSIKNVKNFKNN